MKWRGVFLASDQLQFGKYITTHVLLVLSNIVGNYYAFVSSRLKFICHWGCAFPL
jgi:hypothetical protein